MVVSQVSHCRHPRLVLTPCSSRFISTAVNLKPRLDDLISNDKPHKEDPRTHLHWETERINRSSMTLSSEPTKSFLLFRAHLTFLLRLQTPLSVQAGAWSTSNRGWRVTRMELASTFLTELGLTFRLSATIKSGYRILDDNHRPSWYP
jgi:hypothetical protein